MEYFLQQLVNGLTLGAIFGLIAIGYTMVYGIIGMINFAHGDIYMVGAFISPLAPFLISSKMLKHLQSLQVLLLKVIMKEVQTICLKTHRVLLASMISIPCKHTSYFKRFTSMIQIN